MSKHVIQAYSFKMPAMNFHAVKCCVQWTATWWVKTKRLPRQYAAKPVSSWSIVHSY